MIYECHLTEADYRAFRRHIKYRYLKLHWQFGFMLLLLLGAVWFGGGKNESVTDKIALLIGTLVVFVVLISGLLGLYALFRYLTRQNFRGPLGRHCFDVSNDGVKETNDCGACETKTVGIRAVDETPEYFFVVARNGVGHIVPKRGHSDFTAFHDLRRLVQQRPA